MQGNWNDLDINLRYRERSLNYTVAAKRHSGLDFPFLQGYFKTTCSDSVLYFKGKSRFMLRSKEFHQSRESGPSCLPFAAGRSTASLRFRQLEWSGVQMEELVLQAECALL